MKNSKLNVLSILSLYKSKCESYYNKVVNLKIELFLLEFCMFVPSDLKLFVRVKEKLNSNK